MYLLSCWRVIVKIQIKSTHVYNVDTTRCKNWEKNVNNDNKQTRDMPEDIPSDAPHFFLS